MVGARGRWSQSAYMGFKDVTDIFLGLPGRIPNQAECGSCSIPQEQLNLRMASPRGCCRLGCDSGAQLLGYFHQVRK